MAAVPRAVAVVSAAFVGVIVAGSAGAPELAHAQARGRDDDARSTSGGDNRGDRNDRDDDDDDDDDGDDTIRLDDDDGDTIRLGADGDSGESGAGTLRLDDELDDIGADVAFDDAELGSEVATTTAPDNGDARLETVAMAFARMRADTYHDAADLMPDGSAASMGEQVFSFRAHGRAEATARFGKRFKVKVAGRANADLGFDANNEVGVERVEAWVWDTYADLYTDDVDVRVGNQIIGWGVADLLSPNDVVNPRDLRRGFAERPADLRIPILGASATAYSGPLSLQMLYVPVAPINRFELLEGDYSLLGPNAVTAAERRLGSIVASLADDPARRAAVAPILDIGASPDRGLEDGEAGAAVSLRLDDVDFHGYAYWGHERLPVVSAAPPLAELLAQTPPEQLTASLLAARISEVVDAGAVPVGVFYPRRTHVGAAVATRLEPLGVKFEAGYSPNATALVIPPGSGRLFATPMQLPRLGATVSVDYDRGSELTVVVEASHVRVLDVPEPMAVFQMDGDRLWLTGARIEWAPRTLPLSFHLLSFLDVTSPSYALRPAIRLTGHDSVTFELGAGIYGGPAGSFGGMADRNDELMLTVQYGL